MSYQEWITAACEAGFRANLAGAYVLTAIFGPPLWLTILGLMAVLMAVTFAAAMRRAA